MRSFRNKNRQQEVSEERVEPVPAAAAIETCEYRPFGDEHATLTVVLRGHNVAPGADLQLAAAPGSTHAEVAPSAVAIIGGSVRVTFVVGRLVARVADHVLELLIGSGSALRLPAPTELPPIGWAGGDGFETAVAGTIRGEELSALINLFERRATIAERVIADQREGVEYPQRLAQAYRETAELRSLLDDRESAHRDSAAIVEAAEAARTEHEERAAAAETALEELKDEYERSNTELKEELELRARAIEALETELVDCRAALDEWAAEAGRAGDQLAEAVAQVESLADDCNTLRAQLEAAQAERDELDETRRATEDANAHARREIEDTQARADALARELDESRAHAQKLESKLAASQELLAEGDGRFDAQRTLYEARIASAAESDAKLRRRIDDLEARLGERRSTGGRAIETREARAQAIADAHAGRLSEVTLDEQRAQVAALERQLERIKQRSPA